MLQIKPMIGSTAFFNEDFAKEINEIIDLSHPDESGDILVDMIFSTDAEDDILKPKEKKVTDLIKIDLYHSFKIPATDRFGQADEHHARVEASIDKIKPSLLLDAIEKLIVMKNKTKSCVHEMIRPTDPFGSEIKDGTGVCLACGFSMKDILKPDLSEYPLARDGKYVSQKPWGRNTFVQTGDSGIVLSGKDSYETAFFEACPKLCGDSTFLRGEGKSIPEAEARCWDKFEIIKNCEKHDFTRIVSGKHVTDGYAVCTKCKLYGSFLEPETKCVVCEKPTANKFADKVICLKHQYQQTDLEITKGTIQNDYFSGLFSSRKIDKADVPRYEYTQVFRALFSARLFRIAAKTLGDDILESRHKEISHLVISTYFCVLNHVMGVKTFDNLEFGVPLYKSTMQQIEDHFRINIIKRNEDIDKDINDIDRPPSKRMLLPKQLLKSK